MPHACPDDVRWHCALASGELEDDHSELSLHLENCESCRQLLESLVCDVSLGGAPDASKANSTPAPTNATGDSWSSELRERLIAAVSGSYGRVDSANVSLADIGLPSQLGEYQLIELLGEGGMGVVFRARQTRLNRMVALKVIKQNSFNRAGQLRRFQTEVEAIARLDHPGIVPVFDVGESGAFVFYAMALLDGGTLAESARGSALPPRRAATLMKDIASAVAYVHSRGVMHRDLKPSNILLDGKGKPRVADFGLAKQIDSAEELTRSGQIMGTPEYMAPEQAQGQSGDVSIRTDVYGLGAISYFLLTGRPPFRGENSQDVLHQVIYHEPRPLRPLCPSVPIDLETIALKCLAGNPADRYETANEVANEFDRYLRGEPILARPLGTVARLRRWGSRHPVPAGLVALSVMLLIVGATVSTYFGLVANQRSVKLSNANKQLIAAEESSRIAAEQAESRADAAVRLLETMVFDVQRGFLNDPKAHESRRSLLQSVVRQLEEIPDDLVESVRLKRCQAAAILGLAEVYLQAGDESGATGLTASRPRFEEAIRLFQEIFEAHPDSETSMSELSDALVKFGDALASGDEWRQARDLFLEALPLVEEQAATEVPAPHLLAELAGVEMLTGEALTHTGDLEHGRALLERSCDRYQRLVDGGDTTLLVHAGHARAVRELGDWYFAQRRLADAETWFLEYMRATEQLVSDFPLNSDSRMDLSTAHERLGDLRAAEGDLQASQREHELALDIAIPLGLAAADNDQTQWEVSFSYQRVALISLRNNDLQRALETASECASIRRRIVKSDSTNRRRVRKLLHDLINLAALHCRMSDAEQSLAVCEEATQLVECLPAPERPQHLAAIQKQIENCQSRKN